MIVAAFGGLQNFAFFILHFEFMLNLNLLLPSEKLVAAYELRTRAVAAVAAAIAAVLVVALVLLLPTFFFLSFQKDDVVRLLDLDTEIQTRTGSGEKAERIAEANRIAEAVVRYEADRPELFSLFGSVLDAVPSDVKLDAIEYRAEAGELTIVGFAPSREHLLTFLHRLETNPRFGRVSSPVAGLIRGEDISFSITAMLR